MLIEVIIKQYLDEHLNVPSFFDYPEIPPKQFVLIDRTGGGKTHHLPNATIAFQSYAESKYGAMMLNHDLIQTLENMIELPEISRIELNSDYNFPDVVRKQQRYQAVFDIYHY